MKSELNLASVISLSENDNAISKVEDLKHTNKPGFGVDKIDLESKEININSMYEDKRNQDIQPFSITGDFLNDKELKINSPSNIFKIPEKKINGNISNLFSELNMPQFDSNMKWETKSFEILPNKNEIIDKIDTSKITINQKIDMIQGKELYPSYPSSNNPGIEKSKIDNLFSQHSHSFEIKNNANENFSSFPLSEMKLNADPSSLSLYESFKVEDSHEKKAVIERSKNILRTSQPIIQPEMQEIVPQMIDFQSNMDIKIPPDPFEVFDKERDEDFSETITDLNQQQVFVVTKNPLANSYTLNLIKDTKLNDISRWFFASGFEMTVGEATCITVIFRKFARFNFFFFRHMMTNFSL